jgi:3-hydroxymyristoyl/3-hydroxydecanoyl-(acyl carrier protein) dehydratase
MQEALFRRLSPVTRRDDGTYEASLIFDRDFPGFDGHFPGNPIVPGVCELSAVEILAQIIADDENLKTCAILHTKFRAPLLPDDRADFTLTMNQQDGQLVVSANISTSQTPNIAKIKLALA